MARSVAQKAAASRKRRTAAGKVAATRKRRGAALSHLSLQLPRPRIGSIPVACPQPCGLAAELRR